MHFEHRPSPGCSSRASIGKLPQNFLPVWSSCLTAS
jgi:hypothetical protein